MTKIHPIFEQALAPFLKPVATRNGPEPNVCPDCHGKGASTIDKATGKTVYYCNCDDGFYLCGCEKQFAQQEPAVVRATCRIHRAVAKELTASTPYPWCRQKDKCRGKGSCPLDPTCGD